MAIRPRPPGPKTPEIVEILRWIAKNWRRYPLLTGSVVIAGAVTAVVKLDLLRALRSESAKPPQVVSAPAASSELTPMHTLQFSPQEAQARLNAMVERADYGGALRLLAQQGDSEVRRVECERLFGISLYAALPDLQNATATICFTGARLDEALSDIERHRNPR